MRIRVPDQVNPILGADVSYTCEVPQDNPYGTPIWINPEGQQVLPMGSGKWIKGDIFSPFFSDAVCIMSTYPLEVLGKSVGLCKTAKRKDQLYISLLVAVWKIICENFNPNGLILARILNENINKENQKNSGFGEALQ